MEKNSEIKIFLVKTDMEYLSYPVEEFLKLQGKELTKEEIELLINGIESAFVDTFEVTDNLRKKIISKSKHDGYKKLLKKLEKITK